MRIAPPQAPSNLPSGPTVAASGGVAADALPAVGSTLDGAPLA